MRPTSKSAINHHESTNQVKVRPISQRTITPSEWEVEGSKVLTWAFDQLDTTSAVISPGNLTPDIVPCVTDKFGVCLRQQTKKITFAVRESSTSLGIMIYSHQN